MPVGITLKLWDGDAFATEAEDVIDGTEGFTRSGFLSWQVPEATPWRLKKQDPIDDKDLYWVELAVGTNMDAGAQLQLLTNLFTNDELVSAYYPELISDARYLPPGETSFIKQHIAAKDLIVTRLKKSKILRDESQIIDINEVAIAGIHAFAWIVLNPIAIDDDEEDRAKKAFDAMRSELSDISFDLDFDNSGRIEEVEKDAGNIIIPRL